MTARPEEATTPRPKVTDDRRQPPSVDQLRIALLQRRVAALEQELEAERERRQAIITRFERLLYERQ